MNSTLKRVPFAGLNFDPRRLEDILSYEGPMPLLVVPVNAQVIGLAHGNQALMAAINGMSPVVDGQIVQWAMARSSKTGRARLPKLSGSDLIYECAQRAASEGRKVALVGGSQGANDGAVARLAKAYGGAVVGYSPPYGGLPFDADWLGGISRFLRAERPDIVFFAFGAPKQELLMQVLKEELASLGVRIAVACGGSLDFVSGQRKRAPKWVSRSGLEGLYRLIDEPKLFRVVRLWESVKALRYFRR